MFMIIVVYLELSKISSTIGIKICVLLPIGYRDYKQAFFFELLVR